MRCRVTGIWNSDYFAPGAQRTRHTQRHNPAPRSCTDCSKVQRYSASKWSDVLHRTSGNVLIRHSPRPARYPGLGGLRSYLAYTVTNRPGGLPGPDSYSEYLPVQRHCHAANVYLLQCERGALPLLSEDKRIGRKNKTAPRHASAFQVLYKSEN